MKPRRGAIIKIGAVVDGVVIGWGFRDMDVGAQVDAEGNVVHVGGWTVAELEELLAAIAVYQDDGPWPQGIIASQTPSVQFACTTCARVRKSVPGAPQGAFP